MGEEEEERKRRKERKKKQSAFQTITPLLLPHHLLP
jgi:hypothetical protein